MGKNAVKRYLAMVEFAVRHLGDLVDEYVTINEPNVYAVCGYLGAGFPPGEFNISHALRVMKVMGECHRRAYRLIHNIHEELGYAEPKVGLAMCAPLCRTMRKICGIALLAAFRNTTSRPS